MKWSAEAPSNIALVKYMGKQDSFLNIPTNASLSYTLNHLVTAVELEYDPNLTDDQWEPLEQLNLSPRGQERFLAHFQFLKKYYDFDGHFIVRSGNNFPMGTGLASSASSFAALTTVACRALAELTSSKQPSVDELSQLSRRGSGSSCRSFYSPWSVWEGEQARTVDLPFTHLLHDCWIMSEREKSVSSSEAHRRVKTSPYFEGRENRATQRIHALTEALQTQNWYRAYQLTWDDFHDMHRMFETALEPFRYRTPGTDQALLILQDYWDEFGDGPLVTLDAGPNIHLLYRPDQHAMISELRSRFQTQLQDPKA